LSRDWCKSFRFLFLKKAKGLQKAEEEEEKEEGEEEEV